MAHVSRLVEGYLAYWFNDVIAREVSADTLRDHRKRGASAGYDLGEH